ncbi:hypothetical protein [Marinifilum fragile]|uniref:hypothetical protein n=1 Tax=Marinifilum fragile TaxID=570161 RepID=UPI002AA6480A|nr:hypothetical protein [Marinifilum fragile]
MKKTNAARNIDRVNIEGAISKYDTDPIELGTEHVPEKTDMHICHVNKSLVLSENKTRVVVTCMPGSSELKSNSNVQSRGNQKSSMVTLKNIQESTLYIYSGYSSHDLLKDSLVFLDSSTLQLEHLPIGAELGGKQVIIDPIDLHSITKATLCQTSNPKLKLAC